MKTDISLTERVHDCLQQCWHKNTRPLSVPVATVILQARSKKTSAINSPSVQKGLATKVRDLSTVYNEECPVADYNLYCYYCCIV